VKHRLDYDDHDHDESYCDVKLWIPGEHRKVVVFALLTQVSWVSFSA